MNYKNKEYLCFLISNGNNTILKLSQKLNCNKKTASTWVKKHDLIYRRVLTEHGRLTLIRDLNNIPMGEFKSKYNISDSTYCLWKKEHGIKSNIGRPRQFNHWTLGDESAIGYFEDGEPFYIDVDDYEKLKKYTWRKSSFGYVETSVNGKRIFMHRLILSENKDSFCPSNRVVDHIDTNKLNNKKKNLRITSCAINQINRGVRTDNKTGHPGIHFDKKENSYIVMFLSKRIGSFKKLEDAVKLRRKREYELLGHRK